MRPVIIVVLTLMVFIGEVWADRIAPPRPYVQSAEGGRFYARFVPDYARGVFSGSNGTTRIYQVDQGEDGEDKDLLVDSYNWYPRGGLKLLWSPALGKVAVMALRGQPCEIPETPTTFTFPFQGDRTELSFYLGGECLSSFTTRDLKKWGADTKADISQLGHLGLDGGAIFKVLEPQEIRVDGKQEYAFAIEIKGKKITFDIRTGKPHAEPEVD